MWVGGVGGEGEKQRDGDYGEKKSPAVQDFIYSLPWTDRCLNKKGNDRSFRRSLSAPSRVSRVGGVGRMGQEMRVS